MNSAAKIINSDGCYHCGLPIPNQLNIAFTIDGTLQHFCCPACKTVAETIINGGFGEFYQFRETFADKPEAIDEAIAIDQQAWQTQFIHRDAQGNYSIELLIGGMHCAACTWLLEKSIAKIEKVTHVGVSLAEQKAIIRWHDENFSLETLFKIIRRIGYQAEPFSSSAAKQQQDNERRLSLRRLGIAGLVMMQVGMLAGAMYTGAFDDIVNNAINNDINNHSADTQWGHWLRWTSMIISLPIIYAATPILSGAWRGIKRLQFGMDVSISIALLLAFIASCYATISGSGEIYFDAVTMFVFLLLASRFLEMQARHYQARGSHDIRSLLPSTALKISDDSSSDEKIQLIPLSALHIGDKVLVKSGQIIPSDGLLISDSALIDESMISGESTPQRKKNGDTLIAGTHNTEQPLRMLLTALPGQLRLDHIAKLTDIAAQTKPRFAKIADQLANYFVISVLVIALLVLFIGWQIQNPYYLANTIAVLVVSCPCALSLAMPTALTIATSALRRRGLLITATHVWEELDSITDVIFDKTGTLTTNSPRCVEIKTIGSYTNDDVIEIVASLESSINHPIAEAFKHTAIKNSASNVKNVTGAGISGEINGIHYHFGKTSFAKPDNQKTPKSPDEKTGWLLLSSREQIIAWLRIEELLKPEARQVIEFLQTKNLTIHLLSGDQNTNVQTIAAELGIDQWQANASPEAKLDYLTQLQKQNRRVVMIGDGINDIPILAQADISLAVNSASELAKLRADAILLNNDLLPILTLWQATAKTKKIIRQNLLWALLYNVVAIPLAAVGLVAPWLAAIGMSASSLLVVGNAWRLRK